MNKHILKKSIVVGIILLFACSSFAPSISGFSNDTTKVDIDFENSYESQEKVVVSCQTYGILRKSLKQIEMSKTEAEKLLNKINDFTQIIANNPLSEDIKQLQEEIILDAREYNLLPKDISLESLQPRLFTQLDMKHSKKGILPVIGNRGIASFCNFATAGEGSQFPILILPRMIPILLTPIPRIFLHWSANIGGTTCGSYLTGTGFIASGMQRGTALGFWGIGFSLFLPPVMAYGFIGYALFATCTAEEMEPWPPNYAPEVSAVSPGDGAENVAISTSELSFQISDRNGDKMDYTVTTNPDIGSGSGHHEPDGTYSIPISGLEGSEEYTWNIEVSDGEKTVDSSFSFETEPVAPIVSNPFPEDGSYLVPVDTTELHFHLRDFQGDLMDYTVETVPDIGSVSGTDVNDGYYSVPVSGLDYLTNYKWYVNVTDGTFWKHKVFTFQTKMKMVFNPFDEGWKYRKNITIDHTQISGDLQDFPLLISIIDTDLRDKAQPDGDDILFMDGTGTATRLFHETENYNGSTGELIAWIKLPQVHDATDTRLCMYYGNPTCDNQQFPMFVWDEHYKAVWHMTDEHDSTINSNDLTNYGATAGVSGQIYHCYRFDGMDDYMMFPDIISSGKPLTIELWGNIVGTNAANEEYQGLFVPFHEKKIHFTFRRVHAENVEDMSFYTAYVAGNHYRTDTGKNSVVYGVMNQVVSKIDSSGNAQIYLNGEGKESVSGIGTIEPRSGRQNVIGAYWLASGPSGFSNSYIDEVRVSQFARSAEWIQTQFNNQNFPDIFYIIGTEVTGS